MSFWKYEESRSLKVHTLDYLALGARYAVKLHLQTAFKATQSFAEQGGI